MNDLIDNPRAPEIYASAPAGVSVDWPNLCITFASNRADHTQTPPKASTHINARVVLPMHAARQLCELLTTVLNASEQRAEKAPTAHATH